MRSLVFYKISINYRFLFFFSLGISLSSLTPTSSRGENTRCRSLTAPIFSREAHRILVAVVSIFRKLLLSEATTARRVPILLNKLLKSLHRVINKASNPLSQVPNNNTNPKNILDLRVQNIVCVPPPSPYIYINIFNRKCHIYLMKRNSFVKYLTLYEKSDSHSNISRASHRSING